MPRFPKSIIDKLNKLPLVEMLEEFCEIQKKGREIKSMCPFPGHSDSNPSFNVNEKKNVFFCHGCQKGGGPIQFQMNMWDFKFEEAVVLLCEKHGIFIEERENDDIFYEITELLTVIYEDILWLEKPKRAWDYLKIQRGLTDKTIKEFRIGCTIDLDPSFSSVFQALQEEYDDEILLKIGVGFYSELNKSFVDLFRGRIIWPIQDILGRVIGHAGRDFTGQNNVKYINSPDTPIFLKKRVLFNLNRGQPESTKRREVILFEDYFSVFMAQQNGIKNTVSTMGTNLDAYTSKICTRVTNNGTTFLCLDPDTVGEKASIVMATSLLNNGGEIKLMELPLNEDPDEVLRFRGKDFFLSRKLLSKSPVDFLVNYFKRHDLSTVESHLKVIEEINDLVALIDNGVKRNVISKKLKEEIGLELDVPIRKIAQNFKPEVLNEIPNIEIEFLSCLIQFPEFRIHCNDIDSTGLNEMSRVVFELIRNKEIENSDSSTYIKGFIEYLKNIEISDPAAAFTESASWINITAGRKHLKNALNAIDEAKGDEVAKLTLEYLELLGEQNEQSE